MSNLFKAISLKKGDNRKNMKGRRTKKLIAISLVATMAMPLIASANTTFSGKSGDVDGNGAVNVIDVLISQNFLNNNGSSGSTRPAYLHRLDWNGDGAVTQSDSAGILRSAQGSSPITNYYGVVSTTYSSIPEDMYMKICI
jgi:hypothetical protein